MTKVSASALRAHVTTETRAQRIAVRGVRAITQESATVALEIPTARRAAANRLSVRIALVSMRVCAETEGWTAEKSVKSRQIVLGQDLRRYAMPVDVL
mgnify:CR=1 FL=1